MSDDMSVGSWFQQGPGNASSSLGQVSDLPLTWTSGAVNSVTNASEELVPAAAGVGRTVIISMKATADTGIHIAFGATAATTSTLFLPPGVWSITTTQAINVIRAGSADIDVYTAVGVG